MKTNLRNIILQALTIAMFTLAGCSRIQRIARISMQPEEPVSNASADRFERQTQKKTSSVEAAIKMTEKYTRLSDEFLKLRQENNELATENQKLKKQIVAIEPNLQRTQKELAQANDLLIDMTTELNNWKSQVLGFKNEMRQADEVQLEALLKILEALGGEVKVEPIQNDNQKSVIQDKMKNLNLKEMTSGTY